MVDLNNDARVMGLFPPLTYLPMFRSVTCDSRQVQQGDLFVAISGFAVDGARFADAARAQGAVAVVGESPDADLHVDNGRVALATLLAASLGYPADRLRLCGVTGTNGKTTTAWLTQAMLAQGGLMPGLISTVSISYPGVDQPASCTTPGADVLQPLLGSMVAAGSRAAVMEVSSHAIDQSRIAAMDFAVKGFTNLTQDHLDYHKTLAAYFAVKQRFVLSGPGTAVVNIDDPYGRCLVQDLEAAHKPYLTYSCQGPADLYAEDVQLSASGTVFTLHFPVRQGASRSYRVQTAMMGRFNVSNILCAAAMATAVGVWPEMIMTAIAEAQSQWGRLECVAPGVFVDYAHTDDALSNVLACLKEVTQGRLLCLFGCGGDRDQLKRPKMARAVCALADGCVVTSDNPRSESPDAILEQVMAGVPSDWLADGRCLRIVERGEAIDTALRMLQAGDVLVIAGKGHETYQEINGVKRPFSDRQRVKDFYDGRQA